jgi:hypothetical protein
MIGRQIGNTLLCLALCAPGAAAQSGRGANAGEDPSGVLRLGPLTRTPGELTEILSVMPQRLPKELLPDGATFVVGSSSPSLLVVVASVPPDVLREPWRLQWKLEDSGWISWTPGFFGFRPAVQGAAGRIAGVPGLANAGVTLQLCKGQDFADISFWQITDGPRYMRVAIGPESRRSCAARPTGSFGDVPLPSLEVPMGLGGGSSGSGGGLDDTTARTRIDLSRAPAGVTPETLAAEFVRQMAAAGWKVETGPTKDPAMSTARLSHRSRAGDPVTAMIVVTALSDTPFVDAIVRVVRNKPVR